MAWQRLFNGKFKYIGKDGKTYTGWHKMGKAEGEKQPHISYFGKDGILRTGWVRMGTADNPDGKNPQHWSYFGDNGWLRKGWQRMGKGTQNPDGDNPAHWSYFGDNGWLRTGWQEMGTKTNPDGKNAKHMSYFGGDGWLRTGLQEMGTTKNPDGGAKKHLSYFGDNGWLRTNTTVTVGGKKYKADGKGWLTEIPSKTYTTFVNTRKGKATDFDGRYGAQCVDEIKDYLHYLWGINPGAWGDAHAYYDDFNKHKELTDNFTRIPNTPDFVPKKGDIVVWNKSLGGTGHIAIATGEGDKNHFYSWDQNWTGRNDPMTRIRHDYSKVKGVLRPKNQTLMI